MYKIGLVLMDHGRRKMGDETKDWEVWLDEYTKDFGNITIDMNDCIVTSSDNEWIDYKDWVYSDPNTHNNITLTGGGEEMLRVANDGFYVRGVRVEADVKEAEQVYQAFKQWLAWANLSKNNEE
jgi:hypothetical protein